MVWRVYNWQSQKVGQKGEVLNRNPYRCGFCKGKGFIIAKKANCPVCLGKAIVRIPGLAVICAYCDGNGRAHLNRELPCSVCKGKGVVPIESNNIELCPECKGIGRARGSSLSCLTCKGKGVITKSRIPEQEIDNKELIEEEAANDEEKG